MKRILAILLILPLLAMAQNPNNQKKMTKVVVIGATGSLASVVIKTVEKNPNVSLTLFARNTSRLPESKHTKIQGDALKVEDLKKAIAGQDIVYVNLAGDLDTMSKNIISAMKDTGVKRIIAISSIGIYKEPVSNVLKPYRKLADNIEASGLTYTIIRPDWFTNGDEIDYNITQKPAPEVGGAVSRKSIVDFVSKIIADPSTYQNANVGISKL
ncbi:MAG: NAD(P)H-binding protein [Capnocytophaga sp.]|nr:NAD(P)H-binding protein [Capnocytophaga sp.]